MRLSLRLSALALGVALAAPLAAQIKPNATLNPAAPIATPIGPPPAVNARAAIPQRELTIVTVYAGTSKTRVTAFPETDFACTRSPGASPGNPGTETCTAEVPMGVTLTLTGNILTGLPVPGSGAAGNPMSVPVSGPRWGGDCAGTPGTSCTITMSSNHRVTVGL